MRVTKRKKNVENRCSMVVLRVAWYENNRIDSGMVVLVGTAWLCQISG